MIHKASGNNVRNTVSAVRKYFKWKYKDSYIVTQSESGDNLHRVTLSNEHVIEVTVIPHATCKYEGTL